MRIGQTAGNPNALARFCGMDKKKDRLSDKFYEFVLWIFYEFCGKIT